MSKQDGQGGSPAFGDWLIRTIRESPRWEHPTAFARAAGLSASAVSRWINGRERPTLAKLEKVAVATGTDFSTLVDLAYPGSREASDTPEDEPMPDVLVRARGMLRSTSPLSEQRRRDLEAHLGIVVASFEPDMRRRPA